MMISDMLAPQPEAPGTIRAGRYAILGDIHANLEALMAVLRDAREQHCTRFACVGDIVGYNANPRECLDIVRDIGMPCVKGNHDEYASTDRVPDGFNPRAAASILWTRRQLSDCAKHWLRELKFIRLVDNFSIVHATLDGPQRWGYIFDKWAAAASFSYQNTTVCFFGHTHVPLAFTRDVTVQAESFSCLQVQPGRKYLVNVGSVGEPRDGNLLAAYAIYDLNTGMIELRRVPYEIDVTEAKVLQAGLPLRRRPGVS